VVPQQTIAVDPGVQLNLTYVSGEEVTTIKQQQTLTLNNHMLTSPVDTRPATNSLLFV
jgi:hypothetical protein